MKDHDDNHELNNKINGEEGNQQAHEEIPSYLPVKYHPPKKPSRTKIFMQMIAAAVIGSMITLAGVYYYLPEILNQRGIMNAPGSPIVIEPQADFGVFTAVAKKAMPSVVGITTVTLQQDIFFGTRRAEGLGTGVIVDQRGYILTNSHVVGDGNVEEVTVLFHDGEKLPAEVLWYERTLDLAVIKVVGNNFPVAELGDSDKLDVGEIAVAIGNPLGLNFERTLTQGVISGLNRSIPIGQGQSIDDLIQTDASINPGNSGGPLLNIKGQVIGINTAKIQSGEGLGFAIPINTAKPIVDQFIEKGEFTRVYLGIQGINVDAFEGSTGTKLTAEHGVYVIEVLTDSAAERHGLIRGDIITAINSNKIETMGHLIRELYRYRPGEKVIITVIRNEKTEKIEVEL